jgi:hypothetical protein
MPAIEGCARMKLNQCQTGTVICATWTGSGCHQDFQCMKSIGICHWTFRPRDEVGVVVVTSRDLDRCPRLSDVNFTL